MLMVERQDIHAPGKLEEMVQVGVVTHRGIRHGGDRRDVLGFGKDAELEAQGSSCRGHHSGKLAAANNTDYRKSHISQPTESLARTPTLRRRKRQGGARVQQTALKWAVGPKADSSEQATEGHEYYTY
jgi:hypothetical protein